LRGTAQVRRAGGLAGAGPHQPRHQRQQVHRPRWHDPHRVQANGLRTGPIGVRLVVSLSRRPRQAPKPDMVPPMAQFPLITLSLIIGELHQQTTPPPLSAQLSEIVLSKTVGELSPHCIPPLHLSAELPAMVLPTVVRELSSECIPPPKPPTQTARASGARIPQSQPPSVYASAPTQTILRNSSVSCGRGSRLRMRQAALAASVEVGILQSNRWGHKPEVDISTIQHYTGNALE